MNYTEFRKGRQAPTVAVSVNHRALITRALTKYPVDYALYRELLQNSADARASSATITFHPVDAGELTEIRAKNIKAIHNIPVNCMTFANNGSDFAVEDWNRLREIASGNPNETKIGAFGVGFYSVFELSDEPLVHSGHAIMTFGYAGDQLQYAFSSGPEQHKYQKGTLIDLPYRNEALCPDMVKFTAFLVQSFMLVPLDSIVLKLGDMELLSLEKVTSPQHPLVLPKSLSDSLSRKSPAKILELAHMNTSAFQVVIRYLNATQMQPLSKQSWFGIGKSLVHSLVTQSDDPADTTQIVCFLRRVDVLANVSVSSSFRQKMVDTVLKPPPKQAIMSLLIHSRSEHELSEGIKPPLSSYIFPEEISDAKIFVGFPTKQSTSLKSHLALNQLIPTMERTVIDMSNEFVKEWNCQMLYMAGMMARCVYEVELATAKTKEDAQYTLGRFQFGESAPDPLIGKWVAAGFWRCSKVVQVPSSQGIRPSSEVRFAGDSAKLLRKVPIVMELNAESTPFWQHLRELGYIKDISIDEIVEDIAHSPLNASQFKAVVQWMLRRWSGLSLSQRDALRQATIVSHGDELYCVENIAYYHDRHILSDDHVAATLPYGGKCLPAELVTSLPSNELTEKLGWQPLRLGSWVSHLVSNRANELMVNHRMAVETLAVISRTWPTLNTNTRHRIAEKVATLTFIPTQLGMKLPREAYIKEIPLFPHLPVVSDEVMASKDCLRDLGLRESVDMAFILNALHHPSEKGFKWTTSDLTDYLAENSPSLKASDWQVLKEGAFFEKENSTGSTLSRASELYGPDESLRSLGFPILAYPRWNSQSKQAALLYELGLHRYPSVHDLFNKSHDRPEMVKLTIKYYLKHFDEARYSASILARLPLNIIPTTSGKLVRPAECFVDEELQYFGFEVIDRKFEPYAKRLGIQQRPAIQVLISRMLRSPPETMDAANPLFGYLSKRVDELKDDDLAKCASAKFIPVVKGQWEAPSNVFLPGSGSDNNGNLRELFITIHPQRLSIPFLTQVGVVAEPSLSQIAAKTVKQPAEVLRLVGAATKYEMLLGRFEANWDNIGRNSGLVGAMKRSPFLLGIRYSRHTSESEAEDDNDLSEGQVSLHRPDELAIVDDVIIFSQFKDKIVTVPQDALLESFYRRLGTRNLSQLLVEKVTIGSIVTNESERQNLEQRIRERLRLFLETTSKKRKYGSIKDMVGKVRVELVRSIEIIRQLPPAARVHVTSSAHSSPQDPCLLLVVAGGHHDWLDISRALVKVVLERPDPESVIVLEMHLSSNLSSLQKKGYNVSRLRKKNINVDALKFQPTPSEVPESPLVSGQKPQTGNSQQSTIQQPAPQKPISRPNPFLPQPPDSSAVFKPSTKVEDPSAPPPQPKPQSAIRQSSGSGGGFLSKLGFKSRSSSNRPQNIRSGMTASSNSQPIRSMPEQVQQPPQDGQPQLDPASSLQTGISSTRSFNEARLRAPQNVDPPIPEQLPGCTTPKVHDLQLWGTLPGGIGITLYTNGSTAFPASLHNVAANFEPVLVQLSTVFGVDVATIAMYFDPDTSSVAFNYNGSLFFNVAVFNALSHPAPRAMDYWFPVMAHELAHNLVSAHNAMHSFYTESYIQHFLPRYRDLV